MNINNYVDGLGTPCGTRSFITDAPSNCWCCCYTVSLSPYFITATKHGTSPIYPLRTQSVWIFVNVVGRFPDEKVGQYPMAYVVRKAGSNLSEKDVMEFVGKQVAPYKKIRRVAFIASVPKNPSGKILRKDLIQLATSSSSSKLWLLQINLELAFACDRQWRDPWNNMGFSLCIPARAIFNISYDTLCYVM